jgi:casein kinase 1
MEDILAGLTRLKFDAEPVLGDRTNVEAAAKKAKEYLHKSAERNAKVSKSGDSVLAGRTSKSKGMLLADLSTRASRAGDNGSLATLVKEFNQILQMNSSRTLTKEASRFLDVLYKQLYDPSVFIQPVKVTRTRSFGDEALDAPANAKLGVVARLKFDVRKAQDNKALATLVEEFAKVTNRCAGRSITKVRYFDPVVGDSDCPHRMGLRSWMALHSDSWRCSREFIWTILRVFISDLYIHPTFNNCILWRLSGSISLGWQDCDSD